MKQLLYFILGVTISLCILLPFAQAATKCTEADFQEDFFPAGSVSAVDPATSFFQGYFKGHVSSMDMTVAASAAGYTLSCTRFDDVTTNGMPYTDANGSVWNVTVVIMSNEGPNYDDNRGMFYAFWTYSDTCPTPPAPVDTDGDGIPNELDPKPQDGDPFQYAVMIQYIHATTGEIVYTKIKLDDGTIMNYGEIPSLEDIGNGIYQGDINIHPKMKDSSNFMSEPFLGGSINQPGPPTIVDNSQYYQEVQQYIQTTQQPDNGVATNFSTNTSAATGTETDNQALQEIQTNTDTMNDNIVRLGDYLDSINKGIGEMNKRDEARDSATGSLLLDNNQTTQDQSDALTDAQNIPQDDLTPVVPSTIEVDSTFTTAQQTITGEYDLQTDAPENYRTRTDITEKMAEFISNNPLSDIINNTGVDLSAATPSITWTFNSQPITFTMAPYEAQINLFGQLVLSMATIAGMLMVFRGF